jgi:ankyrin repeat protein
MKKIFLAVFCLMIFCTAAIVEESAVIEDHNLVVELVTMSYKDFLDLCENGALEDIMAAIKNDADVSAKEPDGWAPLMYAAQSNKVREVTAALIQNGAEVDAKNQNKQTALAVAQKHDRQDAVEILKNNGAR